ncbi:hypothetical protein ACFL08_02165 [Patescibacteria group bacterium]
MCVVISCISVVVSRELDVSNEDPERDVIVVEKVQMARRIMDLREGYLSLEEANNLYEEISSTEPDDVFANIYYDSINCYQNREQIGFFRDKIKVSYLINTLNLIDDKEEANKIYEEIRILFYGDVEKMEAAIGFSEEEIIEMQRQAHIRGLWKKIEGLRNMDYGYADAERLRDEIAAAASGWKSFTSWEELETDAEELTGLVKKAQVKYLNDLVKNLRKMAYDGSDAKSAAEWIYHAIQWEIISWEKLKTNSDELEGLVEAARVKELRETLNILRAGKCGESVVREFIKEINREDQPRDVSIMQNLETSKKELARLLRKARVQDLKVMIKNIRQERVLAYAVESGVNKIRKVVQDGSTNWEELGTSDAELEGFVQKAQLKK